MKRYLLVFLLAVLIYACEDPVQVQVQDDILGLWALREQSGTATDVCDGELAQFNGDGTALFQCPGFDPVSTTYTASNNILTFTETDVQYTISKPADTTLVLTGINIDKTLTYGSQ
ncbi:MAG: hypothetical protein KDC42_04205 [Ignavibacteriae bacterium]|nr:hypothetical protein [Ignavibacteriota bacterium]